MSFELLNTFGTLTTVAIIAATAIAAMVQLRHLRAGNQINAMLSIGDKMQGQAHRDALNTVSRKLEAALEDQTFRDYTVALARGHTPVEVDRDYIELRGAALLVGNIYEELGILVKNGVVDKTLFLDRYNYVISRDWHLLEKYTAFIRDAVGTNAIWENFEYLAVLGYDWGKENPSTYPKGLRRLQLHNPWPVPPVPATA